MKKVIKMTGRRGYALMMVLGMVVIMASTIACLNILTRGRVDDLHLTLDRTTAYYLCETGASVAMLDIGRGRVYKNVSIPSMNISYNAFDNSVKRTFNFSIGSQVYPITYVVSKAGGDWNIKSTVSSPYGLGYIYQLEVGGKRAFPFFNASKMPALGGM